MKYTYRALAALLAACFFLTCLAACGGNTPPEVTTDEQTTDAPITDAPDDGTVNIGGLKFTLEGGATYENGAISGVRTADSNVAFCEDIGETPVCINVKTKINGSTSGGISFGYHNEDRRYFLGFDKKASTLKLTCYHNDDLYTVRRVFFPFDNGTELNIRIAIKNRLVKIFVNDLSPDAQPLMEFSAAFSVDKGLKLDCGKGALQFIDISVSDYVYEGGSTGTYTNPIAVGGDPYILPYDGKYYLYATNAIHEGYKVFVSEDLKNWTDMGLCLKDEDVYGTPKDGKDFWAPEVYHIDGRFYLFYTVQGNVGVAVADSPLGPFKDYSNGFLFDSGLETIDANLLIDDDGQMYLYYVVPHEDGTHVHGAKFDLKTCTLGEDNDLISANENWEKLFGLVAEGPCVIKHNGTYYLTYSSNGWTSHDYSVGCAVSSSPLGDFGIYEENPILVKSPATEAYGTGHHGMFYTFGGELMIVYHRHNSVDVHSPRTTCIDRCAFIPQENGPDKLIVYGPTNTPQKLPE